MSGLVSALSQRQPEHLATRDLIAGQNTLDGPVSKDDDSVGEYLELVEIVRDDERRQTVTLRPMDRRVDLATSSQVHSERGVFEHEERRIQGQKPCEEALLLVSTAEGADHSLNARHLYVEPIPPALGDRVALAPSDEPTTDDPDGTARDDVLGHAGVGEDGLRLALTRQEPDALSPGSVGGPGPVVLATQSHPPGRRPSDTGDRPREALVSGIDPPEQADDLATTNREVVGRPPAFGGQTLDVEDDGTGA